jgi:hypothetical protein
MTLSERSNLDLFSWRPPTAEILPFPLVRRAGFARRHAAIMAETTPAKADAHLNRQLDIQRQVLHRRGVDPQIIDQQIAALEAQIRAEIVRLSHGASSI